MFQGKTRFINTLFNNYGRNTVKMIKNITEEPK